MESDLIKDLVSICIPVYNHQETIRETLLSAIHQSYNNIEIVVVDDCSTDNTLSIVNSFKDERIKVYKNEKNLGMVGNWNRAVELAHGEFTLILHGDDRLYITSIEKKVDIIKEDSNVVFAMSASIIINGDNEILMERHPFKNKCFLDGSKLALYSYRKKNIFGEPGNILFKTRLFYELGGFAFNTIYCTDWDMWLRLSCIGRIGYSNEVLMDYRITKTNVTSKTRLKEMLDDDKIMTENIRKYGLLKINTFDVFIHRFHIVFRSLLRNVYLLFRVGK